MNAADPELPSLLAEADEICLDPRLSALLRRHWPQLGAGAGAGKHRALQLRVHPADQMLLHSLRHHRDAAAAVSQYHNVALQQYTAMRQILDALLPASEGSVSVLDFACGWGRLLRLLGGCERELELFASEIQPEALDYVVGSFGVRGLPSSLAPEAFEPGRRFDFIWVASLFSHLPEDLFRRWLARLLALLTPRGVLCFSVHDEALLAPGETLPESGLLFKPISEIAELQVQTYGTTTVSEAFVRSIVLGVTGATGDARAPWRIAKGLAHEQDLYVVGAASAHDLSPLSGFRRGPWGWVDERRIERGRLVLDGWAASIDDGALAAVSVRVDGVEHRCPTGVRRRDVRDAFADDRLLDAGFTLRLELPADARQPWVEVLAQSERGECALLYAGWPDGGRAAARTHVYRRTLAPHERSSLSVLASLVPDGSRVLDLGTGSGALGRWLQQRGCQVDGVTVSSAEYPVARDGYRRLEWLDLEDEGWPQRFAPASYDCIVCADVLEHLREPERVLQACQALLRPGGRLLVSIPNVAYAGMIVELMHGDWKYGPEGLLDRTHLRFFTRRSFVRLLREQGFAVERVEAIDASWYYTEFWTPFDRLPPAVARYLLAQPDASAYQLVFAARRLQDEVQAAAAPAAMPASDPAVQVAVYASTLVLGSTAGSDGTDALPTLHVPVLGRVGAARQTLSFEIPTDYVNRIGSGRPYWHPADRPGYMHLHALTLRDAQGEAVWSWRGDAPGAALALQGATRRQLEIGAPGDGGKPLRLLLTGTQAGIALPMPWPPEPALGASGAGPWRLDVECGWPLSADYLALREALAGAPRAPTDETVEIIVPVYGGLAHLRRCLTSVMGTLGQHPWHLTVIDDASPDAETREWLQAFAALHPQVSVLFNARNLGFVATVNLGMRLAGRRDVVLLNSDTEVAGDWLDRLRAAAWSQPHVGTVTPFSNNATICSFPRFCQANELPEGWTVAALHALFARTLEGQTLEVPTAVGFCMYIRRDCLDETGEFDAASFGAGYGEENDFCLRASRRGWKHLHALDVFVYHAGGASFSERQQALQAAALQAMRRLHPQYEEVVREFVEHDPAREARQRVAAQLALAEPRPT
ncbi:MAG: methyltransferase domain-containing protein [Burkholderiales bacterium]|nr:methyltransferase domain-containing protein [Burkholderiales bacterium]